MSIPPGFEGNTSNKVCKLKKALYGLKQSPRAWFGRFAKVMKEFGYKQSQGDYTLFIKQSATRGVTDLLVYVDDIIVKGNDEREKHEVKQRLAKEFEIKVGLAKFDTTREHNTNPTQFLRVWVEYNHVWVIFVLTRLTRLINGSYSC